MNLTDLPDKLLPPDDADVRGLRRYRWRMTLVACGAFMTVWGVVIPALTVGLPLVGRVAWADEVDRKIEQVVGPIRQDFANLKREANAAQAVNQRIQRRILMNQLAQQLRDLQRIRCADGQGEHTVDRLDDEITAAQDEYRELTGERYPLPPCAQP